MKNLMKIIMLLVFSIGFTIFTCVLLNPYYDWFVEHGWMWCRIVSMLDCWRWILQLFS